MDRVLTLEFVRVTETAAVKAGRLMGKGDKMGADQLAVDGMHSILSTVPIDGTVVILDRPRHQEIIDECRSAGARIKLITDGDVSPAVDAGIEGSGVHVLMGIGGAPEGVLAAAALKCLGGDMQARLIPYTDEERKRCWEMGIDDINRVMTLDDLVKGDDCIFSATAITDTPMMRGVQYFGGGARTMSVVMRYKSGTIRFIDTFHRFDKKAKWSIHL